MTMTYRAENEYLRMPPTVFSLGRESLSITIICIFDPRPRARRIGAYEAPRNLALALK